MKTATDELSMTFAALADPTRRAILERLRTGEATLGGLAEPFNMSLQAVALHLKVLERSGLIMRGRVAQTRPARIAPGPLGNAATWLLRYREFWEGKLRAARRLPGKPPRRRGAVVSGPHLEVMAPHDVPVIVFRRAFQAPPPLVFKAWTEPEHLRHWRVPRGFELVVCEVDLRVGGGYRFVHRAPDGADRNAQHLRRPGFGS